MKRRELLEGSMAAAAAGLLPDAFALAAPRAPAPITAEPTELYPGAYRIASLFGPRNLFQYLLVGDAVVLFDTGIAPTPQAAIFPAMKKLGLRPEQITWAINSHTDGDHQGGNFAVKQASPGTLLACGAADQTLIEDPQALWDLRYNYLHQDFGVGVDPAPSPDAGKAQKVDFCFLGNERIRIRKDWELEVLHVPGHSRGHLALYDRQRRTAFVGDAAHGRGCPKAAGGMALPVTYYYIDVYLSTLNLLANLDIDTLHTGHWPVMRGGEIRDFLAASRQTVQIFDEVLLSTVQRGNTGVTMTELIEQIGKAFSDWPQDTLIFAMFAVKGHMDRLEEWGKVHMVRDSRPFRWIPA
jgi:glyoxylase-like metal-dependent hydrolase (beta-lactamase superfamily II)